jgi:hypothetical protein
VHPETGEVGVLVEKVTWYEGMDKGLGESKQQQKKSTYTTFFTGTLSLFKELIEMEKGNTGEYQKAFDIAMDWFRNYPVKTNKWGPFFEDVPGWSDTQINAITYAMFIMENPDLDLHWKQTVDGIFHWVYHELGDKKYEKYGVVVIDEQTAYRVPGNSHTSREASIELMYWEKSGDTTYVRNAIRQLNWATYMVDDDGKNFYPTNAIWMTDGYGDYTRHYLRAMAAAPQLAPDNEDHLLRSSSIISNIRYQEDKISYTVFDPSSEEIFRLTSRPDKIQVNGTRLDEVANIADEGSTWQPLDKGGILKINQSDGNQVEIIKSH